MKQYIYILLPICLALCTLQAQTKKELEQQRLRTLKQLQETNSLLQETKKNEQISLNKLTLLGKSINDRRKLINTIGSELQLLDAEIQQRTKRQEELSTELTKLRAHYAQLTQLAQHNRLQQSQLLFLLSADSFGQMMRRLRYLQEFAAYQKQQANLITTTQKEIEEENEALRTAYSEKNRSRSSIVTEQEQLSRDRRRENQMLAELKKQEKSLSAKQKAQQRRADELNNRIEALITEEIRKTEERQKKQTQKSQSGTAAATSSKEEQLISGDFEKNKGRLPWPTDGGFISGKYGVQPHPTMQHVTINNRGIYIQTNAGKEARTVYEGEVTQLFSAQKGSYGIIIKHGGYYTVYANLSEIYVKERQKVSAKQAIGKIYIDKENDNKTELYFQIWKDKARENPAIWLAK